ncbi:MAG: hypothetical protein RIG62_03545 [Cyclobacteriaceae bacterium]
MAKAKEERKVVGFLLRNIKTEQFATIEQAYQEGSQISIKIGFDFGLLEEERGLSCLTHVEFLAGDSPFIIIKVRCDFGIDPKKWDELIDHKKDLITFSGGFLQHLAVLTTGTTRGVLHAKTEDTPFSNILMPTLNITKMVDKDMSFELEAQREQTT